VLISDTEYAGPTSDSAQQKAQSLVTRYRGQVDGIFLPERVEHVRNAACLGRRRMLSGKAVTGCGGKAPGVLLEMCDVSKSFGATRALDGVSLTLEAGEVRALIAKTAPERARS